MHGGSDRARRVRIVDFGSFNRPNGRVLNSTIFGSIVQLGPAPTRIWMCPPSALGAHTAETRFDLRREHE
jgi:hypothetical protein